MAGLPVVRVYISGAIGGIDDGNRPAFLAAAEKLRKLGYTPVNPHDISGDHPGSPCTKGKSLQEGGEHNYGCHLLGDLVELAQCDIIMMLDGWSKSPGARAEMAFAQALGIPITHEITIDAFTALSDLAPGDWS
jgi:hypothetical protein